MKYIILMLGLLLVVLSCSYLSILPDKPDTNEILEYKNVLDCNDLKCDTVDVYSLGESVNIDKLKEYYIDKYSKSIEIYYGYEDSKVFNNIGYNSLGDVLEINNIKPLYIIKYNPHSFIVNNKEKIILTSIKINK